MNIIMHNVYICYCELKKQQNSIMCLSLIQITSVFWYWSFSHAWLRDFMELEQDISLFTKNMKLYWLEVLSTSEKLKTVNVAIPK